MVKAGRVPYAIIAAMAAILTGCMSYHTERAADVDPAGWQPADTAWVAVPNTDTLSARDLSFIVRYNTRMRHEAISLTVTVVAPDSVRFSEQVVLYPLPRAAKHSDHYESVIPYRTGNVLRRQGSYMFGFTPSEKLTGITAVGVGHGKN
ncbi:MAG: gliding motility lipoprotein GldH [Rikenellaceae bacterium]|nr:gliding motility lipoprotein GldH [Rikenellaceae bacterium]